MLHPHTGMLSGHHRRCNRCVASEDIVYNSVHEDTLRSAVRASKSAEDTMDMGSIAAASAVLDELIKEEKKEISEMQKRSLGVEYPEVDLLAQEKALELMEITATEIMIQKIKMSSGKTEVQDDKRDFVKTNEEKARRLIEANIVLVPIPSSEKKARDALAQQQSGSAAQEALDQSAPLDQAEHLAVPVPLVLLATTATTDITTRADHTTPHLHTTLPPGRTAYAQASEDDDPAAPIPEDDDIDMGAAEENVPDDDRPPSDGPNGESEPDDGDDINLEDD